VIGSDDFLTENFYDLDVLKFKVTSKLENLFREFTLLRVSLLREFTKCKLPSKVLVDWVNGGSICHWIGY